MRILVGQINPTIGDFQGNLQKILSSIEVARAEQADLILFPELSMCGYPPEDLLCHEKFVEQMERQLEQIIAASDGLMVVVGLVRRNRQEGQKSLYNSAAMIIEGKLIGFYDKWLLPTYDVFDERRYFQPGRGLQLVTYKQKKIGITICEDIWKHSALPEVSHYESDPIVEIASCKPDLLLNLSASPYHFDKLQIRKEVCRSASLTLGCPVVMCCQVGGNDQLVFDGYSLYVDGKNQICKWAKGFEEQMFVIDLTTRLASDQQLCEPIEDLYRALVLGTRDYLRKQGFHKVCLGLSGGIDSALTACIAVEAMGKENLVAVAMPSRYSSEASLTDAQLLSARLGIELQILPIDPLFTHYLDLLAPLFQGKEVDVTEENIQARIRGTLLMALSNKLGSILLSTGNKSEMAVGYCTLYGDMAGGLAVLSDVTKGQVYALSRWINREKEVIPLSTLEKPPSAELRAHQKDSDSLPDYDLVDAVVRAYVEEFLDSEEIAQKYQIPRELVHALIERIHKAEYKRRQAPPGIRVSKKSFRVGRHYPIVHKWLEPRDRS